MVSNIELHDPTKEGVGGLKGLSITSEQADQLGLLPSGDASFRQLSEAYLQNTPVIENVGFVGVNDSRFDKRITSPSELEDLNEFRANTQGDVEQALLGIVKGVTTIGTTFLDGTVGSVVGLMTGINNLTDKDDKTGFWEGFWNNSFSQAMNDTSKWMEDTFKNYYTKDEIENPLAARNIFSGNFIGDKFIKNIGFTIGAYYSGKAFSSLLQASRIPAITRLITKSARAPKMVMSGTGATVSAFNEGRIMALEDSNNWRLLQEEQLEKQYLKDLTELSKYKGTPYYENESKNLLANYEESLKRIQEDQAKMGNLEMFLNLPVLLASNLFEFGKLYANGFKTARKLSKAATAPTKFGATVKGVASGLSEGIEEVAQGAISNISGLGYEQDVLNFYKSKRDFEGEQDTINWMKAISTGLNDTFNDSATAEEFLIGSLTGLFGMPVFGKSNTQQAWLGKDKAVGLAGGLGGAFSEFKEEKERYDKITNYVNERTANNKEFLNYYQGLIRHAKMQKDMDKAAVMGSSKDFKNAEFDQMLSDIMMFDNAGKIEDYMTLIESAFDTSDENLETIIENTTSTLEDGTKKGPFIDSNGNKLTATSEGKAKMIEQLTKSKDEMIQTINNYIKTKDDIDLNTDESLTDDELETLTSMQMKIGNWKARVKEMYPDLKEGLLSLRRDWNKYFTHTQTENLDDWRNATEVEKLVNKMLEADEDQFLTMLNSPKFIESLYGVFSPLVNAGKITMNSLEFEDLFQKFKDSRDLQKAVIKHSIKFGEYTKNPESLKSDLDETYKQLEKKFSDTQLEQTVQDVLNATKDLKSLREALQNIPQQQLPQVYQKVIEQATDEQKKILQDFDELSDIAQSFGTFDLSGYDNEIAAMLTSNMESIISNAESKDDVLNGLNTLKTALITSGDTNGVNAVDALINHINSFLEEMAKAADTPVEQSSSQKSSLLGGMTPTSDVGSIAPTESETEGIVVEGNTKEEALQNAIDKINDLANNGNTEVLGKIATDGISNPNVNAEDNKIIKEIAKNTTSEYVAEADDSSKQKAEERNAKANIKYKTNKSLSSSLVTEHSITDGINKKKKSYMPTDDSLAKIQKLLKDSGAYNLLESGKIGVLNTRTRGGININFLTNDEYPNTIMLATEVTEEFKKRIKIQYNPITINGKEYALLGALKNNSSSNYSEIVKQVNIEIAEQTGDWKVAETTTKIKQFYSGRMVTSDETGAAEERSLTSLITGKTLGRDYGFTIVYTNTDKYIGVDPAIDEITPLNSYLPKDKRNGSLWLMARGSNGVWYPHYVSIARTGEVEWSNTKFFDNIRKHLKTVVQNNSLERKLQAKVALNKTIFFPDGNKFSFADDFISIGGTKVNKKDYATETEYIEAIIGLLKSKNLRFQVSTRSLEEDTTRESIIEAGIIKTDLLQLEHINGSFDIYSLDETPKGASSEHTGSRQFRPENKTYTVWLHKTQYDRYVDESGIITYTYKNGTPVDNESIVAQLEVLYAIETNQISGIEVGNSTYYEVTHNNKKYHVQKTKQQPIKFIGAQEYGRKIKKTSQETLPPPPTGGLLGAMSQTVATPKKEEFDETKPTQSEVKSESKPEPQPEIKPAKKTVKGRKQALANIASRNSAKQGVDSWIKENQMAIAEMAKNANFTGTLSSAVIKGLFESNNISLDTIVDAEDLMKKLDYILNCKQQ